MYICIYVYIYICIYVYMYICIYVYVETQVLYIAYTK